MIAPGDFVERVKPGTLFPFVVGAIYRVRETRWHIGHCDQCTSTGGVLLCDAPDPFDMGAGYRDSWCLCGFRPVYRPKSEIIEHLKAPVPELEPA